MGVKQTEALNLALEALEESLGYVEEEAENAQRLYGQYPTRQARIQGLKDDARKHMNAITAIRKALAEQPAQQRSLSDMKFGGCPFCGSQSCIAGQCQRPAISAGPTTPAMMAVLTTEQKRALLAMDAAELPAPVAEPHKQQEPFTLFESFQEFGEGWERLAWELCADENGEEACSELIWEGGPIPEPWGDRWLKYEDEAKRLIALVQKHTSPPASKPWVGLTDEEIEKGRDQTFSINNPYCPCDSKTMRKAVRWAEAKLREKNA